MLKKGEALKKFKPIQFNPFYTFKEFNGQKYQYMGEFPMDNSFIKDLKRTMFRNGYHIKVQPMTKNFILWVKETK